MDIKEIIINYVIQSGQWPLLILPIIYYLFKKLSNKELDRDWKAIKNKFFWIPSTVLIVIMVVLYLLFFLKIPILPEDRLVVAITRFTPVSPEAKEEAGSLAHRIEKELSKKQHEGAPLKIKRLSTQIEGSDEQARRKVVISLSKSRKGSAHIILWGEVRKDKGELYVEPHLTVARQLRKVHIEERKIGEYVSYKPEHINFKRRLSSEVADIVTLV